MSCELVNVDAAEASELPFMHPLADELLAQCIANASSEEMEVAARLGCWRSLNHPYRDSYRLHPDAEERATRAAWEAASPQRRTCWNRTLRRAPRRYTRPPGSPFTYPAFEPSEEQLQNMMRLSKMLLDWVEASRREYSVEMAELYRQLERFDAAESVILSIDAAQVDMRSQLIARLINEKQSVPMRYMT